MRKIAAAIILCCIFNFTAEAQVLNNPDIVVTNSGEVLKGKIVEDVKNYHLKIMTADSVLHDFSYDYLRDIRYGKNVAAIAGNNNDSLKLAKKKVEKKPGSDADSKYAAGRRDIVITASGKVFAGNIIENVKGLYVKLSLPDSTIKIIAHKDIEDIRHMALAECGQYSDSGFKNGRGRVDSIRIPTRWEKQIRVGLGLTIGGSILMFGGTILIVSNPGNVSTASGPGYASVNFHHAAAAGFVINLAGIPMFIVGLVKMVKNKKRIDRYISRELCY
jgi:hypothetical protein